MLTLWFNLLLSEYWSSIFVRFFKCCYRTQKSITDSVYEFRNWLTAVATSIFFFLKPCHKFIDNFQLPFLELTRPAPERASLRSPSTTATFPMPSKSSAVASVSSPTLQKKQSHTKSKSHSTMNKSQVRRNWQLNLFHYSQFIRGFFIQAHPSFAV